MDEATLERRLHLNMTLIGGFMVGYGVINRHDILGSAQTGNMVSLAMDAVGHADEEWFFRIIALIIYVASVSLTVILSHKISKMSQKRLSILIDGAVLLIIGFYPAEMNPFVALFPIFFATAFQWCSFKGADGFASSSIFCSNNLRQCVTGFTEYLCNLFWKSTAQFLWGRCRFLPGNTDLGSEGFLDWNSSNCFCVSIM